MTKAVLQIPRGDCYHVLRKGVYDMNSDYNVVYSTGIVTYSSYESRMISPHHRKCIDGKITGCGNCVGYCQFRNHPGYLTKELRKMHDCVKKGCNYYVPKVKVSDPVVTNPFTKLALMR